MFFQIKILFVTMVFDDNNLLSLISRDNWKQALERIRSHPNEVYLPDYSDELPIHLIVLKKEVPISIVELLIKEYPQSLQKKTKICNHTPLHNCVIQNNVSTKNIIKLIIQNFTLGASLVDYLGHTPLHSHLIYCDIPSFETVKILVEACPNSVRMKDKFHLYPLHCAAHTGNWYISQYLIKLFPQALLEKSNLKNTPRDIAVTFHKPKLYKKILEEEKRRFL